MKTALRIRQATVADVPTIVELYQVLYNDDGRLRDPTLDPTWASLHGEAYFASVVNDQTSVCWLAEQGPDAVGYLIARLNPANSFRSATLAELESMAVRPKQRRSGIGHMLAQTFIDWARDQHATHMRVTAYATNDNAIAFYRQLGFTPHQITLEQVLK